MSAVQLSAAQPVTTDLIATMKLKQSLLERAAPTEAFADFARQRQLVAGARLREVPVAALRTYAEQQGRAFVEAQPGGAAFENRPPCVIGEGNQATLRGVARSQFIACLDDVRLRGRSAVIEAGEAALLDVEESEFGCVDDQWELDPAVFCSAGRRVSLIESGRATDVSLPEAFTLLGPHTYSFGHWMWEYLPKYVAATQSGAMPPVPVLVDDGMPPSHREALEHVLLGSASIVPVAADADVAVERLWCGPTLMYMPLMEKMNERFRWDCLASPPERFAPVIREMNRRVEQQCDFSGNGSERVFLARRPLRHRKLVNHQAVEAVAESRGFVLVYPEDLSFAAQARVLRHARHVLGPEGSAMFLAYFSRPGTRLCILNHPHTAGLAIYQALLGAIGLDVTVFTGPHVRQHDEYLHFGDYEIDPVSLEAFLDRWLDDPSP